MPTLAGLMATRFLPLGGTMVKAGRAHLHAVGVGLQHGPLRWSPSHQSRSPRRCPGARRHDCVFGLELAG